MQFIVGSCVQKICFFIISLRVFTLVELWKNEKEYAVIRCQRHQRSCHTPSYAIDRKRRHMPPYAVANAVFKRRRKRRGGV